MEPKVEIIKNQKIVNEVPQEPTWNIELKEWKFRDVFSKDKSGDYYHDQSMYTLSRAEMLVLKEALNKANLD